MNAPSPVLLAGYPACCDDETWKPIPAWPHEASTCGQVRSIDRIDANGVLRLGALLPPQTDKRPGKGYAYYDLRDGKRRRRIPAAVAVLEAHDKPRPGPDFEACHGNGRTDNHLAYLRWDTREANVAEMWEARRAVTDTLRGLSQNDLGCHNSQVRSGRVVFSRLSQGTVTSASSQGTVSPPFLLDFLSHFISVNPSVRSVRTSFPTLRNLKV